MTDTAIPKNNRNIWRELLRSPKGITGAAIVMIMLLCAIFGTWLAPQDPVAQVLEWRFAPTFWSEGGSLTNVIGGDNLGRDIFSRVLVGARVSVEVAILVVSISLIIGTILGAIAGFMGGIWDAIINRIIDFQLSFPFMLMALMFMAIVGAGFMTMVFALTFALWVNFARVVRSMSLRIVKLDFIDAAITMGVPKWKIILTHVLPNVVPAVLVVATLDVALVIIYEAALSFLGLGVQPPTVSWGGMISDGKNFLFDQPWMVIGPGLAVFFSSVGVNLLGDFLRDYYDPRLEGQGR